VTKGLAPLWQRLAMWLVALSSRRRMQPLQVRTYVRGMYCFQAYVYLRSPMWFCLLQAPVLIMLLLNSCYWHPSPRSSSFVHGK
jgi:hypothetical protein